MEQGLKVSKYAMQTIAYGLMDLWAHWTRDGKEDVMAGLNDVGYEEYHNFWKVRVPEKWYEGILDYLQYTTDDVLVEVAAIKGDHAKDLHYHKISHAICIILGPNTGFPLCRRGYVEIDTYRYRGEENKECYFPTECEHTFHGGVPSEGNPDGLLYFISVQSPPLVTNDGADDFYWVHKDDNSN